MKQKYIEESGYSFDEASDIAIRLRVLAGEIFNAKASLKWLKNQMFADTACGEYLEMIAQQRGISRKQAVKSQGELTFYLEEPIDRDVIVPVGTSVATADSEPVRFVTCEEGEITAGNTLVSVSAEAETAGSSGNISLNKAVVPVSVPAEISRVTNREVFINGEDAEPDFELRERIRSSYVNRSNGTNKAYYEQLALSVDGIAKVGVVAKARGAGTINIYVCGRDTAAAPAAIAKLSELVNKQRELNVDAQVVQADFVDYEMTVRVKAKSGKEKSAVRDKCTEAFVRFINSIPIGGKLYLSVLGRYLLETDCIETYEFDASMTDREVSGSQCFRAGEVTVEFE